MTSTELQARSLQRAKDRRIHVFAVPGRPGFYTATSESEPGTKRILVARSGEQSCSCPGFNYRKDCCHLQALLCRLARESRKGAA